MLWVVFLDSVQMEDPILSRQDIKLKYSQLVWDAYLYQDKIRVILDREMAGSLTSIVQLFLQYVVKEWVCPNCLQVILPFMKNCYKFLPEKGDIIYVHSRSIISHFPVLSCPHCEVQIVVVATNEYSDFFEFRYKEIKGTIYDLKQNKVLTEPEIQKLGIVIRNQK